jgi:hypothetical protein
MRWRKDDGNIKSKQTSIATVQNLPSPIFHYTLSLTCIYWYNLVHWGSHSGVQLSIKRRTHVLVQYVIFCGKKSRATVLLRCLQPPLLVFTVLSRLPLLRPYTVFVFPNRTNRIYRNAVIPFLTSQKIRQTPPSPSSCKNNANAQRYKIPLACIQLRRKLCKEQSDTVSYDISRSAGGGSIIKDDRAGNRYSSIDRHYMSS